MELPSHPQYIPDSNINSLLHMLYPLLQNIDTAAACMVHYLLQFTHLISLHGPLHWLPQTLVLVF